MRKKKLFRYKFKIESFLYFLVEAFIKYSLVYSFFIVVHSNLVQQFIMFALISKFKNNL